MKNKKILIWSGIVMIIIIIASISVANIKKSQSSIKIGASLALTGNLAYLGNAEMNGLILASEEINNAGGILGRKLEIVTDNNQGDAKIAVSGMDKLLSIDNSDFIYTAFTNITQAIKGPVAQAHKVLIYASTVRAIAQENPNFFVDYYDGQAHGTALAQAFNKFGYKKYNLLAEKSDTCNVFAKAFADEASTLNISLNKQEAFDPTNKDFSTTLLKLKNGNYPIVMCTWRSEDLVMKQMKALGMINTQTFHVVAPFLPNANTKETLSLFAENKAVSSWYGFSMDQASINPKLKAFVDSYKKRFNVDPISDSVYTYDDVYALKTAIELCKSTDTECVSAKLKQVKIDGVGGVLSFNKDKASERDSLIIQNIGGVWKKLSI